MKLKCDQLLSTCAFRFNLRCYNLELLARLYAARQRHGLAAQVFFALAERHAAAPAVVSLEQRGSLLDLSLKHAKSRAGPLPHQTIFAKNLNLKPKP